MIVNFRLGQCACRYPRRISPDEDLLSRIRNDADLLSWVHIYCSNAVRVSAFPKFAQDELVRLLDARGVALSPTTNTVAISAVVCPQSPVIILHFKPSLNALSLLSDVISSMKVLSLKCG